MHKKLASDLTSLAHSILQMKNKEDVFALKQKAHEVYEKLSLLAYVEEYINTTPQAEETKEELIESIAQIETARANTNLKEEKTSEVNDVKEIIEVTEETPVVETINEELEVLEDHQVVEQNEVKVEVVEETPIIIESIEEKIEEIEHPITVENVAEEVTEIVEEVVEEPTLIQEEEEKKEEKTQEIEEQPFDELESLLFGEDDNSAFKEAKFIEELKAPEEKEEEVVEPKIPTLEDELKDTLPVDIMADLFQKVEPKKTINDHLQTTIQIGLNDRIAFVKHLFDGNQTDFNRVISQLNTFKTEREAKNFISKMVKPDYDWSAKEEYEIRFLEIIERRFA